MEFNCKTEDEKWSAIINQFQNYNSYYMANISARGSSINILVGSTDNYNWVALPTYNISSELSHFSDVFWNTEKLTSLIGIVDAVTVATAISFIYQYEDTFKIQEKLR